MPHMASGEGAMKFALAAGSSVTNDNTVTIKIYKKNQVMDESGALVDEYQLVRRYNSANDVPDYLSLVAGSYKTTVQVGERNVASFDQRNLCYYGEKYFNVTAKEVVGVEVKCDLLSTIVKVQYDSNIAAKFKTGYATTVAIDDEYNQAEINSNDVHSLKYTETKDGYFLMPEGQTTLVWQFEGINESEIGAELPDKSELVDGKIVKGGKIENVQANARYTISLKYSADAPGGLVFEASVEENFDKILDQNISFSPDPTLLGDGFDMAQTQRSIESRNYLIGALAALKEITLEVDGTEYDVLNNSANIAGLTLTDTSTAENVSYTLALAPEFFSTIAGGEQNIVVYIEDFDGGKKEFTIPYVCQGVLAIADNEYDLWYGTATFKACVLDETATDVKIAYRAQGTSEWTVLNAVEGSNNEYSATATTFSADKTYEYKLVYSAGDMGRVLAVTTPAGTQIPNAGFENWHTGGDGLIYPYASGDMAFWLTGNNSFATLTESALDARPGSTGKYCAHLVSQNAGALGITKFAAGNLFTGTFRISGTNGTVTFGTDFNFTAKPESFSFWMKNNEGEIDAKAGNPGSGTDIYTIMVLITDGTTYAVNTSDESTFLKTDSFGTKEGIIGYGFLTGQDSNPDEWVERTINITYREDMKNVKPKKIVLSFTPSGYGDYFCGSTKSWMKVDDVRLNY